MRFREHRGSLKDAMTTVVDIEPTQQALCDHINTLQLLGMGTVTPNQLTITKASYDPRINWATCWVTVESWGVVGCIDHVTGEIP